MTTKAMILAYKHGITMEEIGNICGLSRQRIQQRLKACGITRQHGQPVRKQQQIAQQHAVRDHRSIAKWGVTYENYKFIPVKARDAFQQQRQNARKRGITWRLNLGDWWRIWQESGHWLERGRGHGRYVMSRRGDVGTYTYNNVFIQRSEYNNSDRPQNHSGLPTGVTTKTSGRSYEANIMLMGRRRYLGSFDAIAQAQAAYTAALQSS